MKKETQGASINETKGIMLKDLECGKRVKFQMNEVHVDCEPLVSIIASWEAKFMTETHNKKPWLFLILLYIKYGFCLFFPFHFLIYKGKEGK